MKLLVFLLLVSRFATAQNTEPTEQIPELNTQILAYLKPFIGKKIDRGECWDVAKAALNHVHAKWDGFMDFGKQVDSKTAQIHPGDIIQFEKAEFKGVDDKGNVYKDLFYHHTAIVYSVGENGKIELIHQNTGQFGKKVGVTKLDLSQLTTGKFIVYRPVG